MRGVDQFASNPTDDIESQMIVKKKQKMTGASSGGLLIKDEGFEGFNSVGEKNKMENQTSAEPERDLTDFER